MGSRGFAMKTFLFKSELLLPAPIERVFPFFADADNLETLTPPWLGFEILTAPPIEIGCGSVIDYRLRLHGLSIRWQSEITAWEPPRRFVDEQRRGPYRMWIHEHRFEPHDRATLAFDVVHYAVFGGALAEKLFVARELEKIFSYRRAKLREIFEVCDSEHAAESRWARELDGIGERFKEVS
jgi:ligand-binding SRPBCC domain-containing protein